MGVLEFKHTEGNTLQDDLFDYMNEHPEIYEVEPSCIMEYDKKLDCFIIVERIKE